jgi:hypothetical protein
VSSDPASNEKRRNEMRRKTRKQQPKLSSDSLLKTSKRGAVELTEQELGKVTGGRRAGTAPVEFLKVKLNDVILTHVT